jgi:uncharacterized membrane protein YraQ (UPF0718 family)
MDLFTEINIVVYYIVYQFGMIFPYYAAGVIAGSLISVFASRGISRLAVRITAGRHRWTAIPAAAILGAASPVCMYGTIPMIASLGKKGVSQSVLASFMISSILINPNLLIFSFALGAPAAVSRLIVSILAGVAAGSLLELLYKNRQLYDFTGFEETLMSSGCMRPAKRFFSDLHRAVIKTAPYFIVGIVLTALFERYFPKRYMVDLFGNNKGFGVLLATSLGVPVYVCGGGTIPLLKSWMDAGMSFGAAMAFMISGPATKITNLSAVKIILGTRNFILYIVFILAFAALTGWVVDFFT